ncbi:MAG: UDP-N-acetylmuramoyl-L-alanine--D-glutamate ligase [Phycisphaerales bacterium]|nr:UDP-N-acetylmuramoyl-L-alanine--D-glutamate ligase [Phycisphaerales bacterium]
MDLANSRVTLMGLGRFGGGVGAARWLAARGARVLITDVSKPEDLREPLEELAPLISDGRITLRLGSHDEADFRQTDMVVVNPAVPRPWQNAYLRAAFDTRVPITTEIGLLIDHLPSRRNVIGITGSVGKSTTSAMIAHAMAATERPVVFGGNIGGSLLESLDQITADTWVVLELSSAMLYWIGLTQRWSPGTGVCTNLSPNHVDWHGTLDHYASSKQELLRYQTADDVAILGPGLESWAGATRARVVNAGDARFDGVLKIPGAHNRQNAGVALVACREAAPQTSAEAFASRLATFGGLPHRLELVHEHDGQRFYNDSKCTTVSSLMQALDALRDPARGTSHIHLIAGGYDKRVSLSPVAQLAPALAGLYCVGKTGPAIASEARALAAGRVHECETVQRAAQAAMAAMRPGDVLLLSPACASWDQFPNYEHRGAAFATAVREKLER